MKLLGLFRHAKSDWDDPFNGDHNRRLNARGHRAAGLVGAWLAEHGYLPDHVQCSTATRCIETWLEIKEAADLDLSPEYEKGIYHASSDVMMTILNRAEGDTVMFLRRVPGQHHVLRRLRRDIGHDRQRSDTDLAVEHERPRDEIAEELAQARTELLRARDERPQPARDDKVLTAWNGLMIAAFADAGRALDEPSFVRIATEAADFILAELRAPEPGAEPESDTEDDEPGPEA